MPSPDCVQGYKHGDAGAWFALSTGRYLCRAGARRAQMIVTCTFFPHRLWLMVSRDEPSPVFFLKTPPPFSCSSKILKEYVQECSRLKWESTSVPMGDVKTEKISKSFHKLCFRSVLTSPLKCGDADRCGYSFIRTSSNRLSNNDIILIITLFSIHAYYQK